MLNFHTQHHQLHQEMHARPYPTITAPCVISHIAFFHDKKEVACEYECINKLAKSYHVNGIAVGTNSYFQEFEHFNLRWENHREFSTVTIIRPMSRPIPSNSSALEMFPDGWLENFPGEIISATNISISDDYTEENIQQQFGKSPNIASHLITNTTEHHTSKSQSTIWTTLQLDKQGFTRFYMNENMGTKSQTSRMPLGRLVLKILEIETYRQMALLALPIAKSIAPQASKLGQQCAGILDSMTKISSVNESGVQDKNNTQDESKLLQELTNVAAEVERLRASSSYRFSATRAYAELVNSRLEELEQQRVEGKDMLGEFLQKRFMPAIRTCKSVQLQLESLSKRLTRASDLLRTRVDQTIAEQNQKLLESMNRRSHMQLRLQQTVEGLSVAAISYYLISLLKIFLHGVNETVFQFDENLVLTISAPIVLLGIYMIVRNMKKHFVDSV